MKVVDEHIEAAAGQIHRQMFAEIPESDETVAQVQFL
jgi:hypothetical protein